MEEEKKPLEKSCSSLKGQLEEDKAVEVLTHPQTRTPLSDHGLNLK
jgi:hypothetical protein